MIITVNIYQTNKKFFVTEKPKNACKLDFADHSLRGSITLGPIPCFRFCTKILYI